ncbi:MAG: SgcJ/EcaC family oxidoreductase [Bdellovibrionales bacterium]|nr:SgcJ/EcaC family oxidoreductase [Bdellovibrionales bacterium]
MKKHEVETLIDKADQAIMTENFDALMEIYDDEAMLVVKPDLVARGKTQIRQAFENIAQYFQNSIKIKQNGMKVLEAGDTALVLAQTLVSASNLEEINRKATYIFKKNKEKGWLCIIDNSYGHELLDNEKIK